MEYPTEIIQLLPSCVYMKECSLKILNNTAFSYTQARSKNYQYTPHISFAKTYYSTLLVVLVVLCDLSRINSIISTCVVNILQIFTIMMSVLHMVNWPSGTIHFQIALPGLHCPPPPSIVHILHIFTPIFKSHTI